MGGSLLSCLSVLWILNHVKVQPIFKNTQTNFKNRKKKHSQMLPMSSSLSVCLCISETGESGSEFSHFSINTNMMQSKTSPMTFPR